MTVMDAGSLRNPQEVFKSREMYQEHILDLYKNPDNFGELKDATSIHTEFNTTCGDEVKMQVILQDQKIKDIKFLGKGCAISIAAASLLSEKVKGMNKEEVMNLKKEDMIKLLEIQISPARIKCALLALEALQKTIK